MNDSIVIGIKASGDGVNITNLKISMTNEKGESKTLIDEGVNSKTIDVTKVLFKGIDEEEHYSISVMDRNRESASTEFTVYKDSASEFTNIYYHESLILGYPDNTDYGHYLDPFTGEVYNDDNVEGQEANVHIMSYYYLSSGKPSPTLICPGQDDAVANYPLVEDWDVLNVTNYDYHSTDYDLISPDDFDAATNDSLLMVAFNPEFVNPKCKYATQGKVVPFQTTNGKLGLIKVIHADTEESGYMEIAIKVQK